MGFWINPNLSKWNRNIFSTVDANKNSFSCSIVSL